MTSELQRLELDDRGNELELIAPGICDTIQQLHEVLVYAGLCLDQLNRYRDTGEKGYLFSVRRDHAVLDQMAEQSGKWIDGAIRAVS